MIAFIVCKFFAGKEQEAVAGIRKISAVKEVYLTFGGWDAVVVAQAPTMEKLSAVVVREVRAIPGVMDTETLISANF